jgi:hypothetical protein
MTNENRHVIQYAAEKVVQLRSRYVPLVKNTLPGKKAATFFQLDERISMMINLEFASQMPLLHGTTKKRQTNRTHTVDFRYPRPCGANPSSAF